MVALALHRHRPAWSQINLAPLWRNITLRQMFVSLNMFAINQPEVMLGNVAERFDASGKLTDEVTKLLIRQLLGEIKRNKQQSPLEGRLVSAYRG